MTATCALHFDATAAGTCERCGRFACETCLGDGAFCTECAPQAMDPYGMNRRLDHFEAVRIALRLVAAELPKLALITLLFSLPVAFAQSLVPEGDDFKTLALSYRISNLFEVFMGAIGTQAMLAILIARAEGRSLRVGAALMEGVGNWRRFIGARIRSGLWIVFFTLLLVLPGIWQAVLLLFTGTAALRVTDVDALEASRRVVTGRFWSAFVVAVLSLASVVAVVVVTTIIALVLDETSVPRFVPELLTELATRFATDAVGGAILLVSFVMLHVDAGVPLEPMRWREPPPRQS